MALPRTIPDLTEEQWEQVEKLVKEQTPEKIKEAREEAIKLLNQLESLPKLKLIAEDERGASWQILLPDNRELVLIYTRKGFWRGGHYHTKPETSLVLSGKLRTRKIIKDIDSDQMVYEREIEVEKSAGETISNKAGEPHVTIALEDYWLIDSKVDAKIGEWQTINYKPYRDIVDKQMTTI